MPFPFSAYLFAFGAAFLTSWTSLPLWRTWCERTGLIDDPGHRKIHAEPIPLAGGLAVLTGLAGPLLLSGAVMALGGMSGSAHQPWSHGWERRWLQILFIMAGALVMLFVGLLDDRHELRPAAKFAGQALAAVLVAGTGTRIQGLAPEGVLSFATTVLWILTITNALNFLDNMNGLCAGLGAIGSGFFALQAAAEGQYLVAAMEFLTCGALAGFLPHNFPRAKAFLGDAGSHLTGYLLAIMAILPHVDTGGHEPRIGALRPLLVLGVPLFDLVSVVWIRWRLGKPFYLGDTNHISHRLVRRGLTRATAVLVIWLAGAVCGFLGSL